MSKLSKYYKVTNQILVEFISDQYENTVINNTEIVADTSYVLYQGLDNQIYYSEMPDTSIGDPDYYSDMSYFMKFPDESDSNYEYLGLYKNVSTGLYYDDVWISNEFMKNHDDLLLSKSNINNTKLAHDKIRIHFIYGFMLDDLAGFTLQLKTNVKTLKPKQRILNYNRFAYDDNGNPIFDTINVEDDDGGRQDLEPLIYDTIDLTFLDIFFPKECMILDNMIKYHTTPIYQNGAFYDRYIDFTVPSVYYMSVNQINLDINSVYGSLYNPQSGYIRELSPDNTWAYTIFDEGEGIYKKYYVPEITDPKYKTWYEQGRYDLLPQYALPTPENDEEASQNRKLYMSVLTDPEVIINFATVRETNSTQDINSDLLYKQTFFQDPINQIAFKYKNNSDLFNIRIYEDEENAEIIYYPVFGIGNNVIDLNYDVMMQIETGAIPMITEGFMDKMEDIDKFSDTYGENAFKWIIANDFQVIYNYKSISNQSTDDIVTTITQQFTNIIDYGLQNPDVAGEFWKNVFIPKVKPLNNLMCSSIVIQYTGRLVNRLSNVEAIRTATLVIKNTQKYSTRRISINNVHTYKIVNQIKKHEMKINNIKKEQNDKILRSYYDVTNLVVKDMNNNNLYTQGQMTLQLKHTSHNYMFRLFTLNSDNARIPYDLTGPFRYKLIFPTTSTRKIEIYPNAENSNLNYSIGQLVFYITEDQVKQIMSVNSTNRYFAIVTDTENSEQLQSTLYEGKVAYL